MYIPWVLASIIWQQCKRCLSAGILIIKRSDSSTNHRYHHTGTSDEVHYSPAANAADVKLGCLELPCSASHQRRPFEFAVWTGTSQLKKGRAKPKANEEQQAADCHQLRAT